MPLFGPPDIEKLEARRDVGGLTKALTYQQNSQEALCVKIRTNAATALGRIGDPRGVQALIAVLRSGDLFAVRKAAAVALGQIGDPRAVDVLVTMLGSRDSNVREVAAEVLGQIRDPRAVDPLIVALRDEHELVRYAAATALGQMSDLRVVGPLVAALRDERYHVRAGAANALKQIRKAQGRLNGVTMQEMALLVMELRELCRKGVQAKGVIESAERAGYTAADEIVEQVRASHDALLGMRQRLVEKGGESLVREIVENARGGIMLRDIDLEYLQERWIEARA